MAIPSRILASGNSPLATVSIAGDGAVGITATGTTLATATLLSAVYNRVSGATVTTGISVALPPTEAGATVFIYNISGQTISVFPQTGSTINDAAASVTLATAKSMACFALSGTQWASITGA